MSLFGRNIISSHVVKARADKLKKRALRDAKKRLKQEEIIDVHTFRLYLQTIDAQYVHLKNDINDATMTVNYTQVRTDRIAETQRLIDFFDHDNNELARLHEIVLQKAKLANRMDDLRQQKLSPINIAKLKADFEMLIKKKAEDK